MFSVEGSLMDIKSLWTEYKNFEMVSFHWEVSVSAEVRNPLHSDTGTEPSAAVMGEGLTPCKDRSSHKAEKCGKAERVQGLTAVKKGANRDCSSGFSGAAIVPAVSQEY